MNTLEFEALRAIDEVRSRQEITQQCHRYCRALDRMDEPLLRSVFHEDSTHHHDVYRGSSSDFCGYAMQVVRGLESTQHLLGNVLVEIDGDLAASEAYFLAHHRIAAGVAGSGMFAHHDIAIAEDVFVGGRYIDRFERREGVWRIAHRTGVHEWESWRPASDRYFPTMAADGKGRRDTGDPVYRITPGL